MTEIDFHVNVPDKLEYSCRLLRKACRTGAKITVIGERQMLDELDQLLWRFSRVEFLPHCRDDAEPRTLAATPVVLTESAASSLRKDVLINIGQALPAEFEGFRRLIEVVALASDDAAAGRGRWKRYSALGYAPTKHEYLARDATV